MKGNGNGIGTLARKLYFYCIPTSRGRSKYIAKHKDLFHHVGSNVFWQPRKLPADPELISLGDNVKVAANVSFINHDINYYMLNCKYKTNTFQKKQGCIKIGSNVMIGAGVRIMPDVSIGDNCVIGAGAIVTKDIPSNSVAAGVPCKVLGNFDDFVEKQKQIKWKNTEDLWAEFMENRT